jgi:hypothetical protein
MQRFHFASIARISSLRLSNLDFFQRNVAVLLCGVLSFYLAGWAIARRPTPLDFLCLQLKHHILVLLGKRAKRYSLRNDC